MPTCHVLLAIISLLSHLCRAFCITTTSGPSMGSFEGDPLSSNMIFGSAGITLGSCVHPSTHRRPSQRAADIRGYSSCLSGTIGGHIGAATYESCTVEG